jgi:hypothetical protein
MSAAAAQKFSELAEAFEEVRSQLKDLANDPDVLQGDRIVTSLGKTESSLKDVVKVVSDSSLKADKRHHELLNRQLALYVISCYFTGLSLMRTGIITAP